MRELAEPGIIESGWLSLKAKTLAHVPASATQVIEMRKAFYAGCAHLFGCVTTFADGDDTTEPTEEDLNRLSMIEVEIYAFIDEMKRAAKGNPDPL